MTDLPWRARARIDLAALAHNVRIIRQTVGEARIIAIIKADAYGHGLNSITTALTNQVDAFAVATMEEGIHCRQSQTEKPILVLSEFWQPAHLDVFQQFALQPVVHSVQQANWLTNQKGLIRQKLDSWIKFDSGMNRLGLNKQELERAFSIMQSSDAVGQIRIMSHLANADDVHDDFSHKQIQRFVDATSNLHCDRSMSNSAGVMLWPSSHFQWVRPGLILYGVSPYNQTGVSHYNLRPVMHLQARLLAIKEVKKGQAVGYGGCYITPKDCRIAMVGFGYGDGYPRQIDQQSDAQAHVLIQGRPANIIGKISMDMITVDVSHFDNLCVGDEVTLWGEGLGVEQVAQWANTIPYELLCKVTTRIPRQLVTQ